MVERARQDGRNHDLAIYDISASDEIQITTLEQAKEVVQKMGYRIKEAEVQTCVMDQSNRECFRITVEEKEHGIPLVFIIPLGDTTPIKARDFFATHLQPELSN